jgi:hypothetical protein
VSHSSEAAMWDAALGPPEPLLVEAHILILLLQPSLGVGKVCGAIQLILGGRDLCLEDHPVGFDRSVQIVLLISPHGGMGIGGPRIRHSGSHVNELRLDIGQLPQWMA